MEKCAKITAAIVIFIMLVRLIDDYHVLQLSFSQFHYTALDTECEI